MAAGPALSVVVGTLNRLESLKRCITSILAQTRTPVTIYVTDAGSTDGTLEYLTSIASTQIVPLLRGKRLGQARAYNEVFKMVATPYVAWLSDDNEVVNNGLDRAVAALRQRSDLGMVGLKVRDRTGPFVKAPYIGGITSAGVFNINQGVLRTKFLKDIGYFSEVFGFYGIDADLTTKVLYQGKLVALTRQVAIHHYRDWADVSTEAGVKLKANQDRSLRLYQQKYKPPERPNHLLNAKKRLWEIMEQRFGARMAINAPSRVFGARPRDWYNAMHARYISPLDPFRRWGDIHLVQWIPFWERPSLTAVPDTALIDE